MKKLIERLTMNQSLTEKLHSAVLDALKAGMDPEDVKAILERLAEMIGEEV